MESLPLGDNQSAYPSTLLCLPQKSPGYRSWMAQGQGGWGKNLPSRFFFMDPRSLAGPSGDYARTVRAISPAQKCWSSCKKYWHVPESAQAPHPEASTALVRVCDVSFSSFVKRGNSTGVGHVGGEDQCRCLNSRCDDVMKDDRVEEKFKKIVSRGQMIPVGDKKVKLERIDHLLSIDHLI